MPRANNPIDPVLRYFRTASIELAEQALHIGRGIIRDRKGAAESTPTPVAAKPKRRRGPNKPKAAQASPPGTVWPPLGSTSAPTE